ncbi:ATPase [Mycobacterium sp. CBMA 234]|uniref:SRPBCC family protein n=1 Tax=Mycolicibacterium sp. CBMA 234 TaxID=1918495 RepID=UPI0012DF96DC|nr:SRPBCC family protein [Mycolicibacterium sp. CBMA 234]MUL64605.1 ATPase [Mycolicibacterium sp. CBMA 234]
MTEERYVATRTIAATPAAVFAVLANPTRHKETEPGDWVRDAVDSTPITAAGQVFAMNMYLVQAGGDYVTHNLVTAFERDKTVAWATGSLNESREHTPGGWWWRYDLAPNGDGTDVTLTYDWTDTPQAFRDQVGGMPPFQIGFIEESLAALDRAVTG